MGTRGRKKEEQCDHSPISAPRMNGVSFLKTMELLGLFPSKTWMGGEKGGQRGVVNPSRAVASRAVNLLCEEAASPGTRPSSRTSPALCEPLRESFPSSGPQSEPGSWPPGSGRKQGQDAVLVQLIWLKRILIYF